MKNDQEFVLFNIITSPKFSKKSNDDELTLETFNSSITIPPLQITPISKTNIIRLATNSRNRISSLFESFFDSLGKDKFPRNKEARAQWIDLHRWFPRRGEERETV